MFSSIFNDNATSGLWSSGTFSLFGDETSKTELRTVASSPLEYAITHVFLPIYSLHDDVRTQKNDHALVCAVHAAARVYNEHVDQDHKPHWFSITKMLENLKAVMEPIQPLVWNEFSTGGTLYEAHVVLLLGRMKSGDMLAFPTPHENEMDGVVFSMKTHSTVCKLFSMSRQELVSWSGQAVEIPNQVLYDRDFLSRLASSLSGASVLPLADILRSVGHTAESNRITKRVFSTYLVLSSCEHNDRPERSRSHLWFFIKITIQSFLDHSGLGHRAYKSFILFFMCNLANYAVDISPPSLLLHSMSVKILRRFRKFGSSAPQWLCDTVTHTCTRLSRALDQRWREVQVARCSSQPWNPSQFDLARDIKPSLAHIHQSVSSTLADHSNDPPHTPFLPNNRVRGTLDDLLSHPCSLSFTNDDVHITLYDVERAVGEDIDDWILGVTDVDKACEQLERLVHQYQSLVLQAYRPRRRMLASMSSEPEVVSSDPDHFSVLLLTILDLWIALDKLVVREIPLLAAYSPEVPMDLLSRLLLRDTISLHRLCCAYQYLSARHDRARPEWSVFSNQFTEDSFACRYYDDSPHLQYLKTHIQSELPSDPLHAKIVVFEMQCPVSFDRWRSVTCLLSPTGLGYKPMTEDMPVRGIPALAPHVLNHWVSLSLYTGPATQPFGLPGRNPWGKLYYVYQGSFLGHFKHIYNLPSGPFTDSGLQQFLDDTKHTANEVLAAQADCHRNLSLQEFVTFAQLRSGGSLQWFNILRELRSRSLDFRRREVYLLVARSSAEVGPFDRTGLLLWHEEIQDPSYCCVLLDELESLFMDIGAGSSEGPAMATISLLAGVVASKHFGDVSDRAVKLLRNVRRRTYAWVHELLYNTRKSHTNQGIEHLRDMAAVCRSTFDIGPTASQKLFRSARDIETALSCAMIIQTTVRRPPVFSTGPTYSEVLLNRDRRLSFMLEESLRNAIQADISDLGVDCAVQLVWPEYRPSPRRWQPLEPPNSRWLMCETAPTKDNHSQTAHINLLDGSLLVDRKPISNKSLQEVASDPMYRELFGDNSLMVAASDLPGMDFVMTSMTYRHRIHFVVHGENSMNRRVVIRAQSLDTDDIFELIPRKRMQKYLPRSLVEDHLHWLDVSKSIIEIRPTKEPWKQSSNNWTIHLQSEQPRVTKGVEILVDKHSATWAATSNRFRCLDDPGNLIITVSPVDVTRSPSSLLLSVTLPRYGLSFFINEAGHLESRDFKDMVYHEDQCIGTLIGLVNRLILRSKAQIEADLTPPCILIPHGDSFRLQGHNVHIDLPPTGPICYYIYQVDSELGCLKGFVDFESRSYLARLHALTGLGCRPDPLTGRTGIEEAISLVWLAGTRREISVWCPESRSPQIRAAAAKLASGAVDRGKWEPPSEDALLREVHLFPSEVAADVQLSRQGPLSSLNHLLRERSAPSLPERNTLPPLGHTGSHGFPLPNIDALYQLFSSLRIDEAAPPFQSQYISRLNSSAHYQVTEPVDIASQSQDGKPSTKRLRKHYVQCRNSYVESLDMVKTALGPNTEFEQFLYQCGQWPRITPYTLFRLLASTSPIKLPDTWKKCLISLALLALDLHRARRLLQFSLDHLEEELNKELENEGCDGWDAAKFPDWLLIQLQGNFLIRRVQADVAVEMMSPRSGKNTVMQMNMGEGKTSVIIPICAVVLADGDQLIRVVVPQALVPQTLQILTDRLCGLVNRPIYRLTFSREDINDDSCTEVSKVDSLHALMRECRKDCGIIVTQPEHVLSLKLSCVEKQLPENRSRMGSTPIAQIPSFNLENGLGTKSAPKLGFKRVLQMLSGSLIKSSTRSTHVHIEFARGKVERRHRQHASPKGQNSIMKLQMFLDTHARDILDESDEVLRPQFQLVYAIGHPHPFEGSPNRWIDVQQILGLVKRHAYLCSDYDSGTSRAYGNPPRSFPHIHIAKANIGKQLLSLVAQDALDGQLSSISFPSELGLTGAVREFLLHKNIHPDTVKTVERYARQTTTWGSLLLLRGLLANEILLVALTHRRWRVDYGLDPSLPQRTMLAIPYRAKDVPAETAEFGHPDMTILLTCLSYYYSGLSEEQLRVSFELLLQQDDPSSDYALWLEDCEIASVPNALQKLSGVNVNSLDQWNRYLVPLFGRNKRAVDIYLSKVVFPSHAKEFSERISGSYWDIVEHKIHVVTGFSGTNDGQYLLPTSISEDDPDHLQQVGSNARVLSYILHQENSSYVVTTSENGERWSTFKLLEMIATQTPEIRVLLDVGAQILDLSNLELAKAWLDRTPAAEVDGAIYFSHDDKLMALTRNGITQPLSSSPLAHQLHRCVAYLDDAHTRGTDLKFPRRFRAAVTLGQKVTKDRLVQGCMRMRKLGHGHSVMFLSPPDVDRRIRGLVAKNDPNIPVTTVDILRWAIHESWSDIQRRAPYWAQQGIRHQSRYDTWSRFCNDSASPTELADAWVQSEFKSLSEMYTPFPSSDPVSFAKLPRQIRERCENLGVLSLRDMRMDEEQEREISREIERERETVERPPRASPETHFLHPDVLEFVRTGVVPPSSWTWSKTRGFKSIFTTGVATTSSGSDAWSQDILATADFCQMIRVIESARGRINDHLRPVHWVLSGTMRGRDVLVLLSPFEANQLMPEIRASKHVHLHLYIPRTTKRMKSSDDLMFYSVPPLPCDWIPPWALIDQLNLFAGQLYLRDYASYIRLCRFLGVHTEDPHQKTRGTVVTRNWFNNPNVLEDTEIRNRFQGTPLPLVMQLLAARWGMDFVGTHIGRILDGWPLTEEDFASRPRIIEFED